MNSSFVEIYRPIAILMIAAVGFAVAPWRWLALVEEVFSANRVP